jgi:3-phosphoshikimate 1-carboxyvinyltransferase
MKKEVRPAQRLYGAITLPGDKSISHRAVMLGSISKGRTTVEGLLDCDDCNYTIEAFRKMGVAIVRDGGSTVINGVGLRGLKKPVGALYAGESGTTMRILPGILAGQGFESVVDGDESLSKRPMKRVIEPLSLMGVDISSARGGYPPLKILGGNVRPIKYTMKVPSAQVKSAILFAALYGGGTTTVEELSRSRDHTERMMKYFGAKLKTEGSKVSVSGGKELTGRSLEVPGDISSASFFMVGAILLGGSKVRIQKVSINPTRAGILDVFSRMGARYRIVNRVDAFEPYADIEVVSSPTNGIVIERSQIPALIDELPAIFVLAAFSKGKTVIQGADELRVKETDRIESMKENLARMGASFTAKGGDIIIEGSEELKGASFKSFGDHRTVMSMVIASLAAKGKSAIDDVSCVSKSFPGFFKALDAIRS